MEAKSARLRKKTRQKDFQHVNARLHVAKLVKESSEALNWDALPQPPYFPEISPIRLSPISIDDSWLVYQIVTYFDRRLMACLSDCHLFRSTTHGLSIRLSPISIDDSWLVYQIVTYFDRRLMTCLSDCHLFRSTTDDLSDQRFHSYENVKNESIRG
ncbi:hypothetical protein AVEN_65109-1 [Araneus ventricosus]|uniref:Uncharacterized protein n=1 Tax=Araneus ventricosus TaxID=182803 RepID=A0A4Y2RXB4_ARAVE|nr:hypothetical protein AVEN_65109-1 [Araneus ventricosus]